MLILTIKTDNPIAELGMYQDQDQIAYVTWHAHYQLAETLHTKVAELLKHNALNLVQLEGLVVYKGPGSFTGLRIGTTYANTLASALRIPITGSMTDDWLKIGLKDVTDGKNDSIVLPEYGSEVRTTAQKK